jgi:hypothetical protein
LFATLLATGCNSASQGAIGYNYTVQAGDTLDAVAGEYQKQGVAVTAHQIMAAKAMSSSAVGESNGSHHHRRSIPQTITGTWLSELLT